MASKRRFHDSTPEQQIARAVVGLVGGSTGSSSVPDSEDSACTKRPRMKKHGGVKPVAMKNVQEKPAVPLGIDEDLDNKLGVAADRVYQSMLDLEQERPRRALTPAPERPTTAYLRCRHNIVKYLADIVCELRLCRGALHLAVSYLDRLSDWAAPLHYVHTLAVSALFVAVKYAERDEKIPYIQDLLFKDTGNCIAKEDVLFAEKQILLRLHWDLVDYVALDFLRYFLQKGCLFNDDLKTPLAGSPAAIDGGGGGGGGAEKAPELVQRMKHLCLLLADSALLDTQLQLWRPSVLAAGIVYTARRILGLRLIVRPEIEALIGLDVHEVARCSTMLWDKFNTHFVPTHGSPRGQEELVHAPVPATVWSAAGRCVARDGAAGAAAMHARPGAGGGGGRSAAARTTAQLVSVPGAVEVRTHPAGPPTAWF